MRRRSEFEAAMESTASYKERRERSEREAENDFGDRENDSGDPEKDTIFDQAGNVSTMLVRSICRMSEARMAKDLFGSRPWMAVRARGLKDVELKKQMEQHAAFKLDEAQFAAKIKAALRSILTVGDCPMLVTHKTVEDVFERLRMVAVDRTTGEPVLTPAGDYIYYEDDVEDEMSAAGGAGPVETGRKVFAKMPTLALPTEEELEADAHGWEWRELAIEEKTRLFHGPVIEALSWKDVFYPLNVACLQEADYVERQYDCRLSGLRAMLDPDGDDAEVKEALDTFLSVPGQHESAGQGAREERGEAEVQPDLLDPLVNVREGWGEIVLTPAPGSKPQGVNAGRLVRFHILYNAPQRKVLHLEYRAASSPRATIPIFLPAINRPRGRAHGIGNYELFALAQSIADECLNSILHHNRWASNPVEVSDYDNTKEGAGQRNKRLKPGDKLTPRNNQVELSRILNFVKIPDLDARTWQIMELMMQLAQAESGATNPSQAATSNLMGSEPLATEINAHAEVSTILHGLLVEQVRDALQPMLAYALALTYWRQDKDETFTLLEGNADAVLALKDARTLADLPLNVEILMTRAKRQEQREAGMAALPLLYAFYQQPPAVQMRVQPALEQALSGLGFDHPEAYFPSPEEMAALVLQSAAVDPLLVKGFLAQLAAQGYQIIPPTAGEGGAPPGGGDPAGAPVV